MSHPPVTWVVYYDHESKQVRWVYQLPFHGQVTVYQTPEQFLNNCPDIIHGLQVMYEHVIARKDKPTKAELAAQEAADQQPMDDQNLEHKIDFDIKGWEKMLEGKDEKD